MVRNDFALSEEIKTEKKYASYKNITGSELNIYKWDINSKIVVIHYSSIERNGYPNVSLLQRLQESELNIKIIVISNESISEYDTIKGYFKKIGLNDIAILLDGGNHDDFEKYIIGDYLFGIPRRLKINMFLRISNDHHINWYFENNVQINRDDNKVRNRITDSESSTQLPTDKFDSLDLLLDKLLTIPKKSRGRRRLK